MAGRQNSSRKTAADWQNTPHFAGRPGVGLKDLALVICGGVLVGAPLAYGAAHPWAYAPLGLALSGLSIVLLLTLALASLRGGESLGLLPRPPFWGLVLGGVLLVLVQLAPLPQEVVGLLSPRALEIRSLGNGFGLGPLVPLSLNGNATVQEILLLWPAVVLFFLVVFTVNSRRQIEGLVFLLLGVALFEALYGLWHFQSHLIWGWKNPHYPGRLCGTFINSNHAAGYLGMTVLLGLGLFLSRENGNGLPQGARRGRSRLRFWSRAERLEPLVRRSLLLLPLLVLLVAFFFAASRGAILALGVGLAIMGSLWGSRHAARWPLYLLGLFLAGVALYSLWLGGSAVFARLLNLSDPGRSLAFWGSWRLFQEFPWLGAGLGAFDDLSYGFVPASLSQTRLTYAHNDWAQLLAETGLAGFLSVGGGWFLFYCHLLKQWRQRRDAWARGLGSGGLAALAAGAIHALGEFPFRIPAYSLTYAAIAALTFLTVHCHPGRDFFDYAAWRPAGSRPAPWVCGVLVVVQAAFLAQAWSFWQAERAAPLVVDSTRLPPRIGAADYARALALNPRHAGYAAGLAQALQTEEVTSTRAKEIEALLQQAIFLAPAGWRHHFHLGNFLLQHYRLDPRRNLFLGLRELAAAATLFPEKAEIHLRLGLALTWTGLFYPAYIPPELTQRAQAHLDKAAALDPALKRIVSPMKVRE